jgi:hypothetical protein
MVWCSEEALILFNAVQNYALVVDARSAAAHAAGAPLCAQRIADEGSWENPDAPLALVLLDASSPPPSEAAAAVARRFPHLPPPRFLTLPFSDFAARFPFACGGGGGGGGGCAPPPLPSPQLVHERGVFLGANIHAETAPLLAVLAGAGVRAIVNCMGERGVSDAAAAALGLHGGVARFQWEDSADFPLLGELPAAVERIEAGVAAGGVFVHCWAGASRSAAAVAAWLCWRHPERAPTVDAARAWLRGCRPAVAINEGFCEQLRAFRAAAAEAAEGEGAAVASAAALRAAVARAAAQYVNNFCPSSPRPAKGGGRGKGW